MTNLMVKASFWKKEHKKLFIKGHGLTGRGTGLVDTITPMALSMRDSG